MIRHAFDLKGIPAHRAISVLEKFDLVLGTDFVSHGIINGEFTFSVVHKHEVIALMAIRTLIEE